MFLQFVPLWKQQGIKKIDRNDEQNCWGHFSKIGESIPPIVSTNDLLYQVGKQQGMNVSTSGRQNVAWGLFLFCSRTHLTTGSYQGFHCFKTKMRQWIVAALRATQKLSLCPKKGLGNTRVLCQQPSATKSVSLFHFLETLGANSEGKIEYELSHRCVPPLGTN